MRAEVESREDARSAYHTVCGVPSAFTSILSSEKSATFPRPLPKVIHIDSKNEGGREMRGRHMLQYRRAS